MQVASAALFAALVFSPSLASAGAMECISAHADGQVLRKSGKLSEAREKFSTCVRDTCPAVIRKDCATFSAELDAVQPSVVVVAQDPAGGLLQNASLSVDNGVRAIAGDTVLLDPGAHRVDVSLPDGRHESAQFLLRESEHSRIAVTMKLAPSDTQTRSGFAPSESYAFGGVAVAALASFSYFGLRGRSKESELDECSKTHTCSGSDVHEMRRLYLAADVSLGVSLVSFGLGTYFFVRHNQAASPAKQNAFLRRLDVIAAPGGYLFVVGGRF